MAIINKNQITLLDSGLTLDESIVIGHDFNGSCRSVNKLSISMQVNFFLNEDKWLQSITNALKVQDFYPYLTFVYDTSTDIKNISYFFDLKLKDYLISQFPTWDPSLLILTTSI